MACSGFAERLSGMCILCPRVPVPAPGFLSRGPKYGAVGPRDTKGPGRGTGTPGNGPTSPCLRGATAWTAVLLLLAACSGTPAPVDPDKVRRFEECQDPEGRAALEQALVHVQAGRDRQALPLLEQVVRVCPEVVRAHRLYQDTARNLGGGAAADMRAFYETMPDDGVSPVPPYVRGRLREDSHSRLMAIEEGLRRDSGFYYAHLSRGRLMRSLGREQEAIDGYGTALALNPNLLQAHLEMAEVLVGLGRFREAATRYESYLRGMPGDREAQGELVRLQLYRLRKPAAARDLVSRLLETDPGDVEARMHLAAMHWLEGRAADALEEYRQVLRHRPDQARAVLNIGNLLYGVLPAGEDAKERYWSQARKAFLLYLDMVRLEEGIDYVDRYLSVPYRLKEIEDLLGAYEGPPPSLADLGV